MRVQAVAKPARYEVFGNIAMRDLPKRMHAGIGAAGAMNANLFATDRLDRVFQCALHRRTVFLNLPAAERGAVIFDGELVARHQLNRAGGLIGVPRRNSSVFIGCLPARCSSTIRKAPCWQATISRSSSSSPGAPAPPAISQRKILTRWTAPSSVISHQAPGNGDNP